MGKQRKIAIIQVFFDRITKRDFSEFLQRRGSGRRGGRNLRPDKLTHESQGKAHVILRAAEISFSGGLI
jgi:hypothetical protein